MTNRIACPHCGTELQLVTAREAPTNDDARRFTLVEAEARWGLSRWTLRSAVRRGELNAEAGARGAYLLRSSAVDAWLAGRAVDRSNAGRRGTGVAARDHDALEEALANHKLKR